MNKEKFHKFKNLMFLLIRFPLMAYLRKYLINIINLIIFSLNKLIY